MILEVDHIVPVAEGGKNDMLNLITSCRDCNRGKSKTKLSDTTTIDRQRQQLEDLNAIREQTEMLIEWKRGLMQIEETQVDAIGSLFHSEYGANLTDSGRKNTKALIRRFGFAEVYEATEIAVGKYEDANYAFDMVGGICYNRRRDRGDT